SRRQLKARDASPGPSPRAREHPLAIDRTKVLEAAQQHAQEGNYEQAIAEFQRLVADDPRDVRALLKIGDLQIKMGDVPAAIATYARVAEIYTEQGIHLK